MKVALLTNFIPPYRKDLLEKLGEKVETLKIFVSTEMEKNRNWEMDHGALDVVVQKSWSYTKNWKNENGYPEKSTVHLPRDTFRLLSKMNPDVVISSELGFRSLMASFYCRWYRKPLVLWLTLSERTETSRKGLRKYLRKYLLKSATTVMGNGKSCERYVRSLNYQGEVFFVPYTINLPQEQTELKEQTESLTVLFVGQLIKRKGVEEMVNAFLKWSKSAETSIRLMVAGDGPEREKLNKLKNQPKIEMEALGSVEYAKISELYRKSDVFIFPTLGDEWGVVVNEALSNRVPVIGSIYSQAVEELIVNGENGWLFHPDNAMEFESVLQDALNVSTEKLFEMRRACPQVLEKVTVSAAVTNMVKAMESACENRIKT